MAYNKISGTPMPTFKLRNGRLELISAVLTAEDGSKVDEFRIRDASGVHKVADDRDIKVVNDKLDDFDKRFDTVIQGDRVKKIIYKKVNGKHFVSIVIIDDNGENVEISFPTSASPESISTPETTTVGEVVLYGSTDGKTMQNSGLTIADSIDDIEDTSRNTLPTSKAVREYIGGATSVLGERLGGSNVTDYGTVLPD